MISKGEKMGHIFLHGSRFSRAVIAAALALLTAAAMMPCVSYDAEANTGVEQEQISPGQYLTIQKQWKYQVAQSDSITFKVEMNYNIETEKTPDQMGAGAADAVDFSPADDGKITLSEWYNSEDDGKYVYTNNCYFYITVDKNDGFSKTVTMPDIRYNAQDNGGGTRYYTVSISEVAKNENGEYGDLTGYYDTFFENKSEKDGVVELVKGCINSLYLGDTHTAISLYKVWSKDLEPETVQIDLYEGDILQGKITMEKPTAGDDENENESDTQLVTDETELRQIGAQEGDVVWKQDIEVKADSNYVALDTYRFVEEGDYIYTGNWTDENHTAYVIKNTGVSEQCTVTYHTNGGKGDEFVSKVTKGDKLTLPGADVFTKDGFRLAGWSTSADNTAQASSVQSFISAAGTEVYEPGQEITVDDDMDLYAYWVKTDSEDPADDDTGSAVKKKTSDADAVSPDTSPVTGDESASTPFYVLAAASAACIVICMARRRKTAAGRGNK